MRIVSIGPCPWGEKERIEMVTSRLVSLLEGIGYVGYQLLEAFSGSVHYYTEHFLTHGHSSFIAGIIFTSFWLHGCAPRIFYWRKGTGVSRPNYRQKKHTAEMEQNRFFSSLV